MMDKYIRINGYFKLPDNCDLDSLEDYEYLRKVANELKKTTLHKKEESLKNTNKFWLFMESKLYAWSDFFSWKMYWSMRDNTEFNHSFRITVGEREGKFRYVGKDE